LRNMQVQRRWRGESGQGAVLGQGVERVMEHHVATQQRERNEALVYLGNPG